MRLGVGKIRLNLCKKIIIFFSTSPDKASLSLGLFPILLATRDFTLEQIGIVVAVYPAVWGIEQLFTGRMADK